MFQVRQCVRQKTMVRLIFFFLFVFGSKRAVHACTPLLIQPCKPVERTGWSHMGFRSYMVYGLCCMFSYTINVNASSSVVFMYVLHYHMEQLSLSLSLIDIPSSSISCSMCGSPLLLLVCPEWHFVVLPRLRFPTSTSCQKHFCDNLWST